jgi:hypothetical protein
LVSAAFIQYSISAPLVNVVVMLVTGPCVVLVVVVGKFDIGFPKFAGLLYEVDSDSCGLFNRVSEAKIFRRAFTDNFVI